MSESNNPCRHIIYHPLPGQERDAVIENLNYCRHYDPAMIPIILKQLEPCSDIKEAGLYTDDSIWSE